MKNIIAINLENISKRYYLHPQKPTLVEGLNPFKKQEEFWALNNINLIIKKGERVGLIGPNGSGKTTLLKIISGITKPTTGSVTIQGKIVSLIELTAGFQPEMNGIDNIFLNGMLLGMTRDKIKSKLKSILDFADIGKFINQPYYTYSSGMALRMGFSIAIHAEPNILLLDEIISVGDKSFQTKSFDKINHMSQNSQLTIVCASHQESILWQLQARPVAITDL